MIKSLFGGESVSEVEIPQWMGLILHSEDDLLKGAGHKYIRRVPTGNPKKPWKYFYKVSGGEGLGHHSEFIEGAAFKVSHGGKEGHFHILSVDGDKLRIKHDESGEESTLTKGALTSLLHKEHAQAIGVHKERLKQELVAVSKHGSEKQKAKIQAEADKAGVKINPIEKDLAGLGKKQTKKEREYAALNRIHHVERFVSALRRYLGGKGQLTQSGIPVGYDGKKILANTDPIIFQDDGGERHVIRLEGMNTYDMLHKLQDLGAVMFLGV